MKEAGSVQPIPNGSRPSLKEVVQAVSAVKKPVIGARFSNLSPATLLLVVIFDSIVHLLDMNPS
jgi:hypothetical protein